MFIVVKIKKLLVRALKTGRKVSHCWSFLTDYVRVEIDIIFLTIYIYFVYSAMSKNPKELPHCLKRAETSVILIVFYDVLGLYCYRFLQLLYIKIKNILYQNSFIRSMTKYHWNLFDLFISTQNHTIVG